MLIEQLFAAYGMTLSDIESWGGEIQRVGGPGSTERLDALRAGRMDAVLDEGIRTWLPVALDNGLAVLEPEPEAFAQIEALGWRRVVLPKSLYPQMPADRACIDFSGWPLYARASLPDRVAYDVCAAFAARESEMPWEENTYTGIAQVFHETDATPMDVPLHPGAARWYEEHPNG